MHTISSHTAHTHAAKQNDLAWADLCELAPGQAPEAGRRPGGKAAAGGGGGGGASTATAHAVWSSLYPA